MGVCVIAIGCTIALGALGNCCAIGPIGSCALAIGCTIALGIGCTIALGALGTCAIEHLNSCGIAHGVAVAHGLCGIALNAAAMCGICIAPEVRQMSTGRRYLLLPRRHLVRDHRFFLRR